MGAMICPVCNSFRSFSNTSMNVHIDQCLSGESTTKSDHSRSLLEGDGGSKFPWTSSEVSKKIRSPRPPRHNYPKNINGQKQEAPAEECKKENPSSSLSSHRVEMKRAATSSGDSTLFSSVRNNLVSLSHASASKRIRFPGGRVKISEKEEVMVLEGSNLAPEHLGQDDQDNFDLVPENVLTSEDNNEEIQESAFDILDEEAYSTLKSLDIHDVGGGSNFPGDSTRQSLEKGSFFGTENSRFPVEPNLSNGGEIFSTDGVDNNLGQNFHMGNELESQDGPAGNEINYSIDIPGPPGGFLSTYRSLAPINFPGPLYRGVGFPDSPSSPPTTSHSNVENFDSRFPIKLPFGNHFVKSEIGSSVAGVTFNAGLNPAVSALNPQESSIWPRSISLLPQSASDINQMDAENVTTYPLGHTAHSKNSASSEVKSSSNSNSVIRLMGKDIMVVNKGDNSVPELSPLKMLPMVKTEENSDLYSVSDVYSGNVQNKGGSIQASSSTQVPGSSSTQWFQGASSSSKSHDYI